METNENMPSEETNESGGQLQAVFTQAMPEEESSRKMSRFAKLLAQRNELKTQLTQLYQDKETYRNLVETFFEEGQPAKKESETPASSLSPQNLSASSLPGATNTDAHNFEAVQFYSHYPEAKAAKDQIRALQEEIPGISDEYAYRIINPERFSQEKFRNRAQEIAATAPQGDSAPSPSRPLQSFSSDELEEKALALWQSHRLSL